MNHAKLHDLRSGPIAEAIRQRDLIPDRVLGEVDDDVEALGR